MNNDALFNAALCGISGGCQNRWLTQTDVSEFAAFRNAVVAAATAVDNLIAPIDELNYGSVRLLQSICFGVYSDRMIANLDSGDYLEIATAIVALFTELDGALNAEPLGSAFDPGILENVDDFTNTYLRPNTTANSRAQGETNWIYYNRTAMVQGELGVTNNEAYAKKGLGYAELRILSGANLGKVAIIKGGNTTQGFFQFGTLRKFDLIVSPFNSAVDSDIEFFAGLENSVNPTPVDDFGFAYNPGVFGNTNWFIRYRRDSASPTFVDTGIVAQSPNSVLPSMHQLKIAQSEPGVWTASIETETLGTAVYSAIFNDGNVPNPTGDANMVVSLENFSASLAADKIVVVDRAYWKLELPRL